MSNYTDAACVYTKIGVTSSQIDTTQMTSMLNAADAEVERIIKTTCKPKEIIELYTGNSKNMMLTKRVPLLNLTGLEIDDSTISLEEVSTNLDTGQLILLSGAEETYFTSNIARKNVKLKYIWGWLEEVPDQVQTTTSGDETAGAATVVTVASGTGFAENDWVKISGFDGYEEITKITSISTNDLTMNLSLPHEEGSFVTKYQVPAIVSQLACVIGAIMGATYMMGSTYTFATGYTVPDYSIQKGVPYPHFNRNMEVWVKERDFIIKQLPSWPVYA